MHKDIIIIIIVIMVGLIDFSSIHSFMGVIVFAVAAWLATAGLKVCHMLVDVANRA